MKISKLSRSDLQIGLACLCFTVHYESFISQIVGPGTALDPRNTHSIPVQVSRLEILYLKCSPARKHRLTWVWSRWSGGFLCCVLTELCGCCRGFWAALTQSVDGFSLACRRAGRTLLLCPFKSLLSGPVVTDSLKIRDTMKNDLPWNTALRKDKDCHWNKKQKNIKWDNYAVEHFSVTEGFVVDGKNSSWYRNVLF